MLTRRTSQAFPTRRNGCLYTRVGPQRVHVMGPGDMVPVSLLAKISSISPRKEKSCLLINSKQVCNKIYNLFNPITVCTSTILSLICKNSHNYVYNNRRMYNLYSSSKRNIHL